jgi:2'-5' RNA ligase
MSADGGPITDDGSPVELYARMPTFGEPELVHEAIPPGTEILELGAGAGRMTHRLLELGHPVVAVDSSAEMLAQVHGAETVHAPIEGLDLGRRFGCVLLASQLVNVDDDRQRADFLQTCARHVASDGTVLVQRYGPAWAADPKSAESVRDGITFRTLEARRDGERLTATVEYEVDGRTWRHGPFTSRILDEAELEARLWVGGLRLDRWIDDARTWLAATPLADISALHVAIPSADPIVAADRLRWDSAGVAVPAHVTILFPFLHPDGLDADADAALREVVAGVEPFQVRFARIGRFPTVTWLEPEPSGPFARLTDAVVARWPDHPPYEGEHAEVVHHLTVADGAPPEVHARLARELTPMLPIVDHVSEVTLSVRRSGRWSVEQSYRLGRIGSDA